MIKSIRYDPSKNLSIVDLLDGFKHKYQDNDQVHLREIKGMRSLENDSESLNDKIVTITVINPLSFSISEDVRKYSAYEGNGIARQVKVPKVVKFQSYSECLKLEN